MRIYSDADREFLDREYDARLLSAGFDKAAIYQRESARVLGTIERIPDIVYDPTSGETLDLYPAAKGGPLFVWIHGGYWRSSNKTENAFVAPAFLKAGVSVASIDYTLAPAVSLDEIVRQVRASIAWLYTNAAAYGFDGRRIHIGGHSAGGQLVGMLLADGWRQSFGLPEGVFGAALSVSGLHDLHPLVHNFVNEPLSLDHASASRNSPLEHLPARSTAHLIGTCGGLESSEFKRQTRDYVDAWKARGFGGEEIAMPGFHHFDIILELEKSESPLFARTIQRIREYTN
ncbi:alpha/beta hydrolase [Undibacter mobilis]|uniref:Alpha/beta hydrolase n=1 Tax=Undibacter mobilis TaxID=2292256 RepID=A0A371B2Y3_9BRAD|nr:alpha/beta hydrolase [Undibacter mobilis]RDV01910.1 alpha/beta hydrolase [Undibacter mobilis]